MNNYNKLIYSRVDRSLNIIFLVTSILACIGASFLYIADVPEFYWKLNFAVGIIMFVVFITANRVNTVFKIIVMIFLITGIAIVSFVGGSFETSFLILLVLVNIIAVLFLESKLSIVISIITIGILGAIGYYATMFTNRNLGQPLVTWGLVIIGYVLVVVTLYICVYTIKHYLFENIDKLEKAIEQSNKLAYYDQLTGLPNEHKFKINAQNMIENNEENGYMLILNLKSLNLINSTLGQEIGDQALIEAARILKSIENNNVLIARIGGNEFGIWASGISEEELHVKFSKMMMKLKQQSSISNKKLEFYASYADYKYGVDTLNQCYRRATLTLTYVKNNNVTELLSYDNTLENVLRRKEAIKDLIEQAIINNEIVLHYQPQFDIKKNRVVGVEGLARWNSEILGNVSPCEFIPVIESLNMVREFGDHIINKACMDYEQLKKKYNEDISISVNISPSHIVDSNIIVTVENALERYKVKPNKLTVEITEDILIEGINKVKPILKGLRGLGINISLDDFGSGYSSLNYLTQLDLDELKIDKSFVDQIEVNERIHILLENIINMSNQFDLMIVAEGVETKKQNDIMEQLGCSVIQGYYYAKPEAL